MKTLYQFTLTVFALCFCICGFAQDTIQTVSGTKIPARIILVTDKVVLYEDTAGNQAVINRVEVKFTTINSKPDYFTGGIEAIPQNPKSNKNVAGIFLQRSASNKYTSIGLTIAGALVAGLGTAFIDSKGGKIAAGSVGGALCVVGFGFNLASIGKFKKAGELLETGP